MSVDAVDRGVGLARLSVGGVGFAVPLGAVATVMPASHVVPDGGDGAMLEGHVPSQFGAIPVADAARVFGLASAGRANRSERRLVVLHGAPPVGLLVDEVRATETASRDDLFPLPSMCGSPERLLVNSVAWNADGAVDLVLDLAALRAELLGESSSTEDDTAPALPLLAETQDGQALRVLIGMDAVQRSLPLSAVRHIDDYRVPAPLPRSHPAILGLLSWRRRPIPLLDPCQTLGLTRDHQRKLVVLGDASLSEIVPNGVLCALAVADIAGMTPAR